MEHIEGAIAAIRTCKTLDSLNSMLDRFDLTDSKEVIDCLNKCMYDPERYFSSGGIGIEDDLELTKQIFLTGTWRLNEYYERMGIPIKDNAEVVNA